jgi:hypothetical protein
VTLLISLSYCEYVPSSPITNFQHWLRSTKNGNKNKLNIILVIDTCHFQDDVLITRHIMSLFLMCHKNLESLERALLPDQGHKLSTRIRSGEKIQKKAENDKLFFSFFIKFLSVFHQ